MPQSLICPNNVVVAAAQLGWLQPQQTHGRDQSLLGWAEEKVTLPARALLLLPVSTSLWHLDSGFGGKGEGISSLWWSGREERQLDFVVQPKGWLGRVLLVARWVLTWPLFRLKCYKPFHLLKSLLEAFEAAGTQPYIHHLFPILLQVSSSSLGFSKAGIWLPQAQRTSEEEAHHKTLPLKTISCCGQNSTSLWPVFKPLVQKGVIAKHIHWLLL